MIKSSFFFLFVFINLPLFSQSPFELEVSKAIGLIERNLTISSGKKFDKKNEFFLYCFILDSSGKIGDVKILREDKSEKNNKIRELSIKIKEKCEFKAKEERTKILLIPVLLIYSEPECEVNFLNEISSFFGNIKGNLISDVVYVTRSAVVTYYRSKE